MAKLLNTPAAVKEDFTDPGPARLLRRAAGRHVARRGRRGTVLDQLGNVLWWAAFALMLAFQVWALVRWLAGGIELAQLNAGWLIILVGGIVLPGPGLALGPRGGVALRVRRLDRGRGGADAAALLPRVRGGAAPEVLRPSWFILLVPPSLIYANGVALSPDAGFLELLFPFGLVLAVALLVYARSFWRWRFGPPWWAFTFPLDALAYAAARYAQDHPARSGNGGARSPRYVFGAVLVAGDALPPAADGSGELLRSAASRRG